MPRRLAEPTIRMDRSSPIPLTAQLASELRTAMSTGVLRPTERLPSSRSLAVQLGVSRTVVTDAYQQLYAEGWLEGRHGAGTFVAEHEPLPERPRNTAGPGRRIPPDPPRTRPSRAQARGEGMIDLRPGAPWVHDHDRGALRRAWRYAAEHLPDDDPDPRGLPRLRELLAEHLRRARGIRVGPENLLVTRGTGNGLDLVAALLGPGTRAGVEEPGYGRARTILAARGAHIVPCPVDHDGLRIENLPDDLDLVYTTPAHQYAVKPLIAAAEAEGVLVEDTSRTSHGAPRVHGLVIGYGSASCAELRRACEVLVRAVERHAG